MPTEKDFKRLVRQRMADTGERYTDARAALDTRPDPLDPRIRWVEQLAEVGRAPEAFELLRALPERALRRVAVAGLAHESWRVRRACCRLLDDLTLTPESSAALETCLDDPHPRVRRNALHTLSCDACKPDGQCVDTQALFERAARDTNAGVRKMVAGTLEWKHDEPWAEELMEHFAATDASAEIRRCAEKGLARIERQRRTDAARRALPEELVRKTERHRGKWVAIAGGTIIGAEAYAGALRRIIKGKGATDAELYWVSRGPD